MDMEILRFYRKQTIKQKDSKKAQRQKFFLQEEPHMFCGMSQEMMQSLVLNSCTIRACTRITWRGKSHGALDCPSS
jgi:hypothetical protein